MLYYKRLETLQKVDLVSKQKLEIVRPLAVELLFL